MLQSICLQFGCRTDASWNFLNRNFSLRLCSLASLSSTTRDMSTCPWLAVKTGLLFSHLPRDERSKQSDWLLRLSELIHSYRQQMMLSFPLSMLPLHIFPSNPQTLFHCQHFSFRLIPSFCLTATFCCYRFSWSTFSSNCCRRGMKDRVVTNSSQKYTNFHSYMAWWAWNPWSVCVWIFLEGDVCRGDEVLREEVRTEITTSSKKKRITASSFFLFTKALHLFTSYGRCIGPQWILDETRQFLYSYISFPH